MSKIIHIDGDTSPRAILEQALEGADTLKAVIVLTLTEDNCFIAGHSKMWDTERTYLLACGNADMMRRILDE